MTVAVGWVRRMGWWLALGSMLQAAPFITQQPQGAVRVVGERLVLETLALGEDPVRFAWRKDGVPLLGENGFGLIRSVVSVADAGSYSVVVSDVTGSVTSRVAQVIVDVPTPLVDLDAVWRYRAESTEPPADWFQPGFNDAAWPSGNALFYHESQPLPLTKRTALPLVDNQGHVIPVHYFRTRFQFQGSPEHMVLVSTNWVDDGAVFFLNGHELGRLRVADGPLETITEAAPAREGFGVKRVFPADALVPGENVLAVAVFQHDDLPADQDLAFAMSLHATTWTPPMPDLVPWAASALPWIDEQQIPATDCAVREECAQPGRRRLLRFTSESRNVGTGDLLLGAPIGNPEFVFDNCHVHYHFEHYVAYRLIDGAGTLWVEGGKRSFCLEDSDRWDRVGGPGTIGFDCSGSAPQGIQRGWSDIYDSILPCQYLDITGVPPGAYELEIEIDPENRLSELTRTNNRVRLPVEIPATWQPCSEPPANDAFADALLLPTDTFEYRGNSACATREAGEPSIEVLNAFNSVWFRWTAPFTGRAWIDTEGSRFATLLAVYTGNTLTNLTRVAADSFARGAGFASRVLAEVQAGMEYRITIAGAYFSMAQRAGAGEYVLRIRRAPNDFFLAPTPLANARGTLTDSTASAVREAAEPWHEGEPGGRSVWFSWTAPSSDPMLFEVTGRNFHPLLGIYTGGSLAEARPVAHVGDGVTEHSRRAVLQPVAGATYRIAVDSVDGVGGALELSWRPRLALSLRATSSAQSELTVEALPNDRGFLEASEDLQHWTSAHAFGAGEGFRFTETAQGTARYFRARLTAE